MVKSQLGVNDHGMVIGSLVNKSQFFGTATAETVRAHSAWGGWNSDISFTPTASASWLARSSTSNQGATYYEGGAYAGTFAFHGYDGFNYQGALSHRTILSGY